MGGITMKKVRQGLFQLRSKGTAQGELFRALERIARDAAKGTGVGRAVEPADLVGELLQRYCEGDFAAVDWLAISDSEARGLLGRRLHQLAVELSPGWNGYRGLRAMVARLLEEGLPEAPEALPLSIHEHDRLSAAPVALAAAWVVRQLPGGAPSPSQVARTLARQYLPLFVPLAPANDDREADEPVDLDRSPESIADLLDAERLHRTFRESDPAGLELLQRRAQGESLQTIARDCGAGITTIHTREGHVRRRLAELVRELDLSSEAVRTCLEWPRHAA